MQLVHFSIELEFDKSTRLHTPAQKVFTALGGKTLKTKPREPGTNIRNEKQKNLINWQYEKCGIGLEKTEDPIECMRIMTQLMETIDNVAPIGKLQSTKIVTGWILPAPRHDFASLNELYMHTSISPKEFMQGTYDSSVILDSEIDDFIFHHQSGPMTQKQLLEEYLIYKRDNLPKVLIFLYTSATYTKVINYNKKEMHSVIENAFGLCERHSNSFSKIWEGYL